MARLKVLAPVVAAVALVMAGCSGGSSNDSLPLLKATISIKNVSLGGACETIPVRIVPKELRGEANKYANNRMMVTEVTMTGPTDENGAPMCNGSAETLPLAPGDWEFSAPLASDTYRCIRDIQADGDLNIQFVDGVDGCGGPEAAAEPSEDTTGLPGPDDMAPDEMALPPEGEAPGEAPPQPAG